MKRLVQLLVCATAVALLAAGGGAVWFWRELSRPSSSATHTETIVLEPGLSAAAMVDRLAAQGVIRNKLAVRAWISLRGYARELHAGEYRFEKTLSPLEVIARLRSGATVLHAVTIPEGLALEEVAARFVEAELGDLEGLIGAFRDPVPIIDLDPRATDLEGYLFPDTYRFSKGEAPQAIAWTLVKRFRDVVGEEYPQQASAAGLDVRRAVTLASLIERETGVATERSRVSRVFHNRLERGMKLECDPTVLYALRREGRAISQLTYRDLAFDSPWNTYRVAGLPPGPIANPGRDSLIAAVQPAPGNELFFVASPGGGHRFSSTLSDHLEAVATWRRYSRSSR